MPKPRTSFRLSEDVITLIQKHQQLFKLKNMTESLEDMIRRVDRLHLYIKYLGSIRQITKETPSCKRRVMHEGEFFCVQTNRKGLNRMKELPTLEICRICNLERYNIPESAKVKKPIEQTIRNPNVQHQGMVYCIDGGLWLFPSKCQKCVDRFTCKNYLENKQN